jgi:hypothetical protein
MREMQGDHEMTDASRSHRLVVIESPYAGATAAEIEIRVRYGRACLADSLARGEAPIASHLLYTLPGVLDDSDPAERRLGIEAGLAWLAAADASVVYADLGISLGMAEGIARAVKSGVVVEFRLIGWAK